MANWMAFSEKKGKLCICHCTCHHLAFFTHVHSHTDVAHTHKKGSHAHSDSGSLVCYLWSRNTNVTVSGPAFLLGAPVDRPSLLVPSPSAA